jgi:hypothetical protein
MTITDTGRRSREQLLDEARREVGDGPLPSKTALSKALRTHFNTASEILDALTAERRDRASAKSRARREALSRLGRRKRNGRPTLPIRAPFRNPSVPVSVVPVSAPVEPGPMPSLEAVRKDSVVVAASPSAPSGRRVATWPALIVAAPAFVAIWAGWVGIGKLTGFGKVNLLPGFWKGWVIDTAITLPVGVEAYAGYAFYVALNLAAPKRARVFAAWTSLSAVALGMAGQTAYHLMTARHMGEAPWQITTVVSCLPVAVFGLAAALVHMVRAGDGEVTS